MTDHHEDELQAEQTAGFKVGEKKTIEEYQKLGTSELSLIIYGIGPNCHYLSPHDRDKLPH
jgi:hypothetical protein